MARGKRLVGLAAILLAVSAVPALSQSRGQSPSGALAISVTVVRSCGVATPGVVGSSAGAAAGDVRVSCGRAPSTSSVYSGGIVPVSGSIVAASVTTSKSAAGLVVSVNF